MGWFPWSSDDEEEEGKDKKSGKFTDTCLLIDYIQEFKDLSVDKQNGINRNGWSNFKCIEVGTNTTPADIISSLTSRGGLAEFTSMDNTTLGLMVPKIRLYKQYYESKQDTVGRSVEYLFDDSLNPDAIEQILLNGRTRSGGAGISEVNWEFNGTNPAEAPRSISVSMKLVFQSAADLLGERYNPTDGTIIAQDNDNENLYTKNYIDLILHPPTKTEAFSGKPRTDEKGNNYVPKFYRIKLIVGWAVPDGNFPNLANEPSREYPPGSGNAPKSPNDKLKEELRAMETSIFLNLVSHQFNIRENGQIELNIDYIGSLEETINGNSANVLDITAVGGQEAIDEMGNSLFNKRAADKKKEQITDIKNELDCLDLSSEAAKASAEELEKNIKALEEQMEGEIDRAESFDSNAKTIIYKKFLEKLNLKVRQFELTEDQAIDWTKSLNSVLRPKFDTIVTNVKLTTDDALTEAGEAAIDQAEAEGGVQMYGVGDLTGTGAETDAESQKQIDKAIKERKDAAEDNSQVNYVYFGDILDVACEAANHRVNGNMDSKMKIITGPIMVTHPRGGRNAKQIHMNLADLPISYDDFQAFFFETVVRKGRASYPLKSFIKDVLERLVRKALQPRECFAEGREQRQVDIGMTNFTIRSSVATELGIDVDQSSSRYDLDPTIFNNQPALPADPDGDYDVMMLFMTSYAAYDLTADVHEDRKKGIYHYYIGAERGLIQKIEFSRSDVQGLREARQAESRNLGQIRDVYNASVKMVGNTLYIPGMKVFLNPPIGFGRPENSGFNKNTNETNLESFGSLSNLLGIGGYYDVIKVQSTISRGSVFTTELDCVFAQSGGEADRLRALCQAPVVAHSETEE